MMIGKIKIGDLIAKPEWTQCGFYVVDMGELYLVGCVFDYRECRWVSDLMIEPIFQEWSMVDFIMPEYFYSMVY